MIPAVASLCFAAFCMPGALEGREHSVIAVCISVFSAGLCIGIDVGAGMYRSHN